jgi:hypothetical protein
VTTIGSPTDSFSLLLSGGSFEMDSRKRLYLGPRIGRDEPGITIVDTTGKYLGAFGRRGGGPGELLYDPSRLVIGPGDTLHAFEYGAVSVFAPSGTFVRRAEFRMSSVEQVLVLGDGRMVITMFYRTPELVGIPVHVFSSEGVRLNSFGAVRPTTVLRQTDTRGQILAKAGADTMLWVAPRSRYEISLWSVAGRHSRTLVREADWFAPWHGVLGDWRRISFPPLITGLFQDAAGYLWVTISVADRNWKPLATGDDEPLSDGVNGKYFDTILEVIDPRRGTVEARLRLDEYIPGFSSQGLIATVTEDSNAVPYLHIWRPILRRN